jgi:hypothetical protein
MANEESGVALGLGGWTCGSQRIRLQRTQKGKKEKNGTTLMKEKN